MVVKTIRINIVFCRIFSGGLLALMTEEEIPKYSTTREKRCVNCGKGIKPSHGLYSRLFCSPDCKEEYFSPIKTV